MLALLVRPVGAAAASDDDAGTAADAGAAADAEGVMLTARGMVKGETLPTPDKLMFGTGAGPRVAVTETAGAAEAAEAAEAGAGAESVMVDVVVRAMDVGADGIEEPEESCEEGRKESSLLLFSRILGSIGVGALDVVVAVAVVIVGAVAVDAVYS